MVVPVTPTDAADPTNDASMTTDPPILVCLTTVTDQDQARQMAGSLLERRIAACVQIDGPIESHYRWEGKLCCEQEYRLVIKTSLRQQTQLRDMIRELHPYDQPEIVVLESFDVDAGYASWVESQTV